MLILIGVAELAAQSISLDTGTGLLHGTLNLPAGKGPFPVALLIAGSGPTDRDGNSAMLQGKNDSLKMLAEGLGARGIASVRYDKRGIAESRSAAPKEQDLRFDTYVEDAVNWGQSLRKDKRFGVLVIAGHSEGSLIGMIAAQKMGADGFVSISGAGRAAAVLLLEQFKTNFPPRHSAAIASRGDRVERGPNRGIDSSQTRPAVPGECTTLSDLVVPI